PIGPRRLVGAAVLRCSHCRGGMRGASISASAPARRVRHGRSVSAAGPRMNDANRRFKQDMVDSGLWSVGGRITAIAGAFLLNLALARSLPPADYGVYFVVLTT